MVLSQRNGEGGASLSRVMGTNPLAMPESCVLQVRGVSKKFCRTLKRSMLYGVGDLLRAFVGVIPRRENLRKDEFWAVQDVSFDLQQGEVLGVIGLNGAGKSTLLRTLNGIIPPDAGYVAIRGKIGGLIAVGAGFHPHMTGRENIFLNGTILGMTRAEIQSKLESIIDFAEIGEFIDAPVSTYSSGMYVRLGFAVAIHCEPDILLIDEVLAVGDLSFQNKAMKKVMALKEKAKAVIFVGHNLSYVSLLCDRIIVLDKGKAVFTGETMEGIAKYHSIARNLSLKAYKEDEHSILLDDISFSRAGIVDSSGEMSRKWEFGQDMTVTYEFRANRTIRKPLLYIGIIPMMGSKDLYILLAKSAESARGGNKLPDFEQGISYTVRTTFKNPNILPGLYKIRFFLADGETNETIHQAYENEDSFNFEIIHKGDTVVAIEGSPINEGCMIELQTDWKCTAIS